MPPPAFRIYFDVSDLVSFIGLHDHLTGIQRVQASIVLALRDERPDLDIRFLTYAGAAGDFLEIDRGFMVELLDDLTKPLAERSIAFDRRKAQAGALPRTTPLLAPEGDACLCLLGAAWNDPDYFLRIRTLKARFAFRFVALVHDLIAITAPDTCDARTADSFIAWLRQSRPVVDQYLCVSESTKSDLTAYFESLGETIREPIVTRNGSFLPATGGPDVSAIDADLRPGGYILLVSTIEARKNHIGAFRALQALKARGIAVPQLVCVGRLGWRAEPFVVACEATDYLGGSIKILSDVSDAELAALYRDCLFTVYPSFYEGWGLPVGESLGIGKVCITSPTSSMPEVGGDLAVYADPRRPMELADRIAELIGDPDRRRALETRIASEYRPVDWADVAGRVLDACRDACARPASPSSPVLALGREYPTVRAATLPAGLSGGQMLHAVRSQRARFLTAGTFGDDDYLAGLSVRTGPGWLPPGQDAAWLAAEGASIAFMVDGANSEALTLHADYVVRGQFVGGALLVAGAGSEEVRIALPAASGTLSIPLPAGRGREGGTEVSLTLQVVPASTERNLAGPTQAPALGLRSILLTRAGEEVAQAGSRDASLRGGPGRVQAAPQSGGSDADGSRFSPVWFEAAILRRLVFDGKVRGLARTAIGRLRGRLLLNGARRAARAGDWARAEHLYGQMLRADPDQPRIWIQYGHTVKEQGGTEAALGAYGLASRIDPVFAEAYVQFGQALLRSNRVADGERALLEADRLRRSTAPENKAR